jgi:hypothetical protein
VINVSLTGIFPMCGRSSTHLQENLFLKVYTSVSHSLSPEAMAVSSGSISIFSSAMDGVGAQVF